MDAPVILDFDGSVLPLGADELRIDLNDRQENIRFACTRTAFDALALALEAMLPPDPLCTFTGSGDYHHLTALLLNRPSYRKLCEEAGPADLFVFDNHPDNMRYPFGIHCGSWVYAASRLPHIASIHVIGITSADITAAHSWETHLTPFIRRKLTYWSIGTDAGWIRRIRKNGARTFGTADEMTDALLTIAEASRNAYISIDKDVLSPSFVRTNWDQGVCAPDHIGRVIDACAGVLSGADITGDISEYVHKGRFKRFLSSLDGQTATDAAALPAMQEAQRVLNAELLGHLAEARG